MTHNKNENSLPANNSNGQTASVHDTDKRFIHSEMLKNCRISKNTADYLACKMALSDLLDQRSEVISNIDFQ